MWLSWIHQLKHHEVLFQKKGILELESGKSIPCHTFLLTSEKIKKIVIQIVTLFLHLISKTCYFKSQFTFLILKPHKNVLSTFEFLPILQVTFVHHLCETTWSGMWEIWLASCWARVVRCQKVRCFYVSSIYDHVYIGELTQFISRTFKKP